MKYKVLLTGTQKTLISDFFNHMDFSFECLSSSTRTNDLLGHLNYYEPNALIYCLNKESKDDIRGFHNVSQRLAAKRIPLIIVGEQENCTEFEKAFPIKEYLTVVRPFSTKSLEETILSYLDSHFTKMKEEASAKEDSDKDESEENTKTPEPAASEKKKHILVVDDDSRVLKLVKSILADRYNVATAINGKVAMKFLENKETDLVLLDYEMPGESGAAVLQKIRNHEKLQKLPVVFLTGVTEKERIREVLALSPQGYLLKPIDTERLNSTIQDIFGKTISS